MIGFLGGIPLKATLGVAGAVIATGGMVGLAHSTPTILRKAGVACEYLTATKVDNKKLSSGHQFIQEKGNNGTGDKFYDVTEQGQQKNGKCWTI